MFKAKETSMQREQGARVQAELQAQKMAIS